MSLGYGYLDVIDFNSAQKLYERFNNFNLYGNSLKLIIKK